MDRRRAKLANLAVAVSLIALMTALFYASVRPHGHRNVRTTCANHLRQLGTVLVTDYERGWPEDRGAGFLLRSYHRHKQVRSDIKIFACPSDERIDPNDEAWRAKFEGLDPDLRTWPDDITSYAGRDPVRYPLAALGGFSHESRADEVLACDRRANHESGINVLFADGKVEFIEWADPRLCSRDEFTVGLDGAELLRPLCFDPPSD